MKDLLSKEHYCYKVSGYPPSIDTPPPYTDYCPPIFTRRSWSSFYDFSKFPTPDYKEGSSHYELPEDLLTVVSEGIATGLTRSGST